MKSQFINDFDKDSSNILPLDMQLNVLFEIVKKVHLIAYLKIHLIFYL